MGILPTTVASDVNARHRIALAKWLNEWALDQAIRRVASVDAPTAARSPDTNSGESGAWRHGVPAEGQIILLPPASATFTAGRPTYVLVLRKVQDCLVVVPFSRFATPATDREWITGLRSKPLRVLCLWNARRTSADMLATGWLTARLRPNKHQLANKVFKKRIESDEPCMAGVIRGLGPPLRHPLDPRHEYLAEETELLDELLSELEREREKQEPEAASIYTQPRSPLLKAAESRRGYGRQSGKPGRWRRKHG